MFPFAKRGNCLADSIFNSAATVHEPNDIYKNMVGGVLLAFFILNLACSG